MRAASIELIKMTMVFFPKLQARYFGQLAKVARWFGRQGICVAAPRPHLAKELSADNPLILFPTLRACPFSNLFNTSVGLRWPKNKPHWIFTLSVCLRDGAQCLTRNSDAENELAFKSSVAKRLVGKAAI
ncbi:MAG: hypothetical protein HYR56_07020 [Acidobacteria bacterium]|nr:hypothetical protein [Acidobacteriota bacterium]MBI3422521.1 hypothetical protein [Acidobacteriota bacterium]